jgi:serine phosphatase RsbU (regulator of sigma subunit)
MDAVPESLIIELRPKILERRARLQAAAGSVTADYIHSRLAEGDSLVLYSDGITEAQDLNGNDYAEERLILSLRAHLGLGAKAMADGVIRDVAQFRGALRPNDDMTLLIVRRLC